MLSFSEIETWLKQANTRYRSESIPHRQRPFRAISDFSVEHKISLDFSSTTANQIFEWFKSNSPPYSHALGSMFTGAYFFDSAFWPIEVPIIYGQITVDAFKCLETMPQTIKNEIESSQGDTRRLVDYWVDCMDYGYGIDEIRNGAGGLSDKARHFAKSADRELRGAISQIVLPRPNTKAILGLRMATEIFMKAVLIQELTLKDSDLKRINHSLKSAAHECARITSDETYSALADMSDVFPAVSSRYERDEWPLKDLWQAVTLAQISATALTRRFTDKDIRLSFFR
ncbi:hypothetical protein [Methylovorus sp. MP688]|uniref:hypothetical protein n=1 Tax=Methylovorus sp. (strain MP688) TaxID=887061 RepID=UPI00059B940F|nr:hypothetical protein [Methylovorus sp. MP688]